MGNSGYWKNRKAQAKKKAAADGHQPVSDSAGTSSQKQNGKSDDNGKPKAPSRPTHFLSLPLSYDPLLLKRHEVLKKSWFPGESAAHSQSKVSHQGLEESIVVEAMRLHLTLGVMNLKKDDSKSLARDDEGNSELRPKTISDALKTLKSLESDLSLLKWNGLKIEFGKLGTFDIVEDEEEASQTKTGRDEENKIDEGKEGMKKNERKEGEETAETSKPKRRKGSLKKCDVLFAEPGGNQGDIEKVKELGELVRQRFLNEGFVLDSRPLQLHLTLINTSHRKPPKLEERSVPPVSAGAIELDVPTEGVAKTNQDEDLSKEQLVNKNTEDKGKGKKPPKRTRFKKRIPFDATEIVYPQLNQSTTEEPKIRAESNLGTHPLDRLQLCAMGSRDKEGRYVSLGEIRIGN